MIAGIIQLIVLAILAGIAVQVAGDEFLEFLRIFFNSRNAAQSFPEFSNEYNLTNGIVSQVEMQRVKILRFPLDEVIHGNPCHTARVHGGDY